MAYILPEKSKSLTMDQITYTEPRQDFMVFNLNFEIWLPIPSSHFGFKFLNDFLKIYIFISTLSTPQNKQGYYFVILSGLTTWSLLNYVVRG